MRGGARRRIPRKRLPEDQQRPRDREAREESRGARARERDTEKFPGLLESRPCARFGFLEEHRGEIGPVKKACGPTKASKSGFYEHLGRKESNTQIERAFTVGERNGLRAGGIACMPAREGWLYLAAATGALSRKAVGWSMSERIIEKVAIDAIGQAVGREGPPDDFSLTSDLRSSRATGSHDPAPLCCAAALLHLCFVLAPHLPRFCALAHSMIWGGLLIFGSEKVVQQASLPSGALPTAYCA